MRGSSIIVTPEPRGGRFEECIISGTPKPGTLVELVPGTLVLTAAGQAGMTGGRFTYRAITRSTGTKGPVIVLYEATLIGKTYADAYANGDRGFLYWPVAGDDLNLLVADVAGTGTVTEVVTVGDLFAAQTITGKLVANSSNASAPFQAMEPIGGAIAADYWLWVKYLGNQA